MNTHRLLPEHLKKNEPLPWDIFDAAGHLLLRRGYVISSDAQMENLLGTGMFVGVDEFKVQHPQGPEQHAPVFNPFRLLDKLQFDLNTALRQHLTDGQLVERIHQIAEQARLLQEKDADAGLSAIVAADSKAYSITHMRDVAFLCQLMGSRLGWDADKLHNTVCAALTMNVSMMDLQSKLAHYREPPTPEQRELIRLHPIASRELLEKAGVSDPLWLQAIAEHHEKLTGIGYPHKLTDICDSANLIRIADRYCAMISPRAYRKAMLPSQAAKQLFILETNNGKNPLPGVLIKELGIYPPGSFVKLANGETGIVTRRGESANTPTVCSLASGKGMPYAEPLQRETWRKDFEIVGAVSSDKILTRLNFSKLWGY